MQGKAWNAAIVAAASLGMMLGAADSFSHLLADDSAATGKNAQNASSVSTAKSSTPVYSVQIELRIAGLGPNGCDVELKPAHRGCSFEPVKKHVERNGKLVLTVPEVRALNADRDCTFAITIKEAGHADRTERRGLRLSKNPAKVQWLECFLNSPSKIARNSETAKTPTTIRR